MRRLVIWKTFERSTTMIERRPMHPRARGAQPQFRMECIDGKQADDEIGARKRTNLDPAGNPQMGRDGRKWARECHQGSQQEARARLAQRASVHSECPCAEDPRAQAGGKARAVRRGQMWMPAHRWVVSRTDQVRTGGAFQQTTHIRDADLPSIAHVPTGKARNALTPMQPHARARGSAATTRAPRTQARSWTRAAIHPYRIKHGCGSTAPRPTSPQSRSRPLHPSPCGLPATGRPQRHAQRRRRAADSTVSARKGHSATTATTRCPTGACQPDRVRQRRRPPDSTASVRERQSATTATARRPTPACPPDRVRRRQRLPDGTASVWQRHSDATAIARCLTPVRPPDRVRRRRRPPDCKVLDPATAPCRHGHRPLPHTSPPSGPCAPATADFRQHGVNSAAALGHHRHRPLPHTSSSTRPCAPVAAATRQNGVSLAAALLSRTPPPAAPHQHTCPTVCAGGGGGGPPASQLQFGCGPLQQPPQLAPPTQGRRPDCAPLIRLPPGTTASGRQRHSAATATARCPTPASPPNHFCRRRAATRQHGVSSTAALSHHRNRPLPQTSQPARPCALAAAAS